MIYVSTTNAPGFIYYFGIFYLKIGKLYTFFQLGKGPIMGPKISPGKSLAWWPSWSCDLDYLYTHWFPLPIDVSYKIWL